MKKMFGTGLSIMLSGAMILLNTSMMITINAETDSKNAVRLELSSSSVNPGEKAIVNLSIKNNPGINCLQFLISYDEKLDSPEIGDDKLLTTLSPLVDDSQKLVSAVTYNAANKITLDDGIIMSMEFNIPDDAESGSIYNISILSVAEICDLKNNNDYKDVVNYRTIGNISIKYQASVEKQAFFFAEDDSEFGIKLTDKGQIISNLTYSLNFATPIDAFNTLNSNETTIDAISNGVIIGSVNVKIAKRGNVSLNGNVGVGDLSIISKNINAMIMGKISDFDDFSSFIADVDGNNSIDVGDLSYISEFVNKRVINKTKTDKELWDSILNK